MRALILAGTPPPPGIPVTLEPSLLRFLLLSSPLPSRTLTQHSAHRRLPYFPRPKSNLSVSPTDFAPREGLWEDPDAESDDEEDDGGVGMSGGEDDEIPDVVASLLSAEEKAILQQNHDPDLSKISTKKWNPLHTLALSGQIQIIDQILECGVHVDSVDKDGFTAFHKAVIGKKESVISYLLKKGANPHVRDRDGATPLHHAVQVGAIQTVKLLIKHKVDVNVADNEGWTPLHVAMQSRSRDIGKILLVNGADKTRRNKDGKTPLDLSLCFGKDFKSYELAKLIKLVPANRYL